MRVNGVQLDIGYGHLLQHFYILILKKAEWSAEFDSRNPEESMPAAQIQDPLAGQIEGVEHVDEVESALPDPIPALIDPWNDVLLVRLLSRQIVLNWGLQKGDRVNRLHR